MSSASVKECLQLQILEMEMLFSMFPNREVKLDDVNALTNIKRYLEGTREALPAKIEFVITLQIEEPKVSALSCLVARNPAFLGNTWNMNFQFRKEIENIIDAYFLYLFESKIPKILNSF